MTSKHVVIASAALIAATLLGFAGSELRHRSQPRRSTLPLSVSKLGATPELAADARAERYCDIVYGLPGRRAATCCGSAPDPLGYQQCVSSTSAALSANTIRVDPAALDACERSMAAELAGCDWVASTPPPPPPTCGEVLRGLTAAGGRCASSLECQAPLHCSVAGEHQQQQARCAPPEPAGTLCETAGDTLSAFTRNERRIAERPRCATGFCSAATRRCEAEPALGAACRASVHCAADQRCAAGECRAGDSGKVRAKSGEPCQSDFDCDVGGCVRAPSATTKVCGMSCPAPSADLLGVRGAR